MWWYSKVSPACFIWFTISKSLLWCKIVRLFVHRWTWVTNLLRREWRWKKSFSNGKYRPQRNETLNWLEIQWDVDDNFEGDYMNDYLAITNELSREKRTAWIDKYTTSLYSVRDVQCRRYELQPMPDYLRWFKTAELHYLPLEERALFSGPWDNIPGAYLPSRILDLCFSAVQHLNDDIMHQISLLAWVTLKEAKEYYHKLLTDPVADPVWDGKKMSEESHFVQNQH